MDFEGPQYETLIGEYEILTKTNLGCLSFDGYLSFLDEYYKGLCCTTDEDGNSVPMYIDNDDNGYDDRYEPTPSPTGPASDANLFGLSAVAIVTALIGVAINFN